ncbi:MAG: DUF3383 family protein [Nanoarchaeota archaeon]|nr:DUF3383 family protein [Nanoarchaeota archaeon]
MIISGIGTAGGAENFKNIDGALAILPSSSLTGTLVALATAQDLTAAYASLGDVDMDGKAVLGILVEATENASQNVSLRVMGMMDSGDTPFEIDAFSVKTLWTTGAFSEKYYEFSTGLLPFVQAQVIAGTVGLAAAYLTGGTSAQGTFGTWAAVSDASFRITIDGTAYNVDAIDFTGAGDMDAVATILQADLRTATGGTETVVWSTDHFIITSGITTASSAVTVTETSTGTVGTDISGAGAADWMDSDTGNGTETAVALAGTITASVLKG